MKDLPQSYFRHDATASSDGRLLKLRGKYGYEGMGVYWHIIETLYLNDGSMDTDALRSLFDRNTDVLEYCVSIGLLVEKDGAYSSQRLTIEIDYRMEKSEKAKKSIAKRWRKEAKKPIDTNVIRTNNQRNTNVILGEERKGEEIILKKPKKDLLSDDDTEKKFYKLIIEQQWCDLHYADKTIKQLHDLRTERRDEVFRKMRVALNSANHSSTLPLAKKIYHEIAGQVNDFGAMEKVLDGKEAAKRRELAIEESGQDVF